MIDTPIIRTRENCFYRTESTPNGCSIVIDEYSCQPVICKWHRTKEEMLESLYKAACNYEKATGYKDYQTRFVPMSLRDDFIEYQAKRIKESYGNK
jgi:hypothetical protein